MAFCDLDAVYCRHKKRVIKICLQKWIFFLLTFKKNVSQHFICRILTFQSNQPAKLEQLCRGQSGAPGDGASPGSWFCPRAARLHKRAKIKALEMGAVRGTNGMANSRHRNLYRQKQKV
jgi:hypothetical protein